MSKRAKGLSLEEKRKGMLEIFYETQDFWNLKELEKMGPKRKGIISQSVKDVVESLVSDGLVITEKIGISNYYWSFPSTALVARQQKIKSLEEQLEALAAKRDGVLSDIAESEAAGKADDSAERKALERRWHEAKERNAQLIKHLDEKRDCDPKLLQAKETAANLARDAANRWTDNIFILQGYISRQYGMSSADFYSQFNIPADLDSV